MSENVSIGGQAIMEGVMMRNVNSYAVALRSGNKIIAHKYPWFSLTPKILQKPFLRGFPILVETLINGIKSLNVSATKLAEDEGEEIKSWELVVTMLVAMGMAVVLFVVVPHLFSIVMKWFGLGGDVENLSFHVWDGLFKFLIFIGYIVAISFVPDIKRVFQYHGAEHKVIAAFEKGGLVSVETVRPCSRLHARCGTTFVLFVLTIAIILHTLSVPVLLAFWTPDNAFYKHAGIIAFKTLLMLPISAIAYELIKYASTVEGSFLSYILQAPGMFLQMLTTKEPDDEQIKVAIVSLAMALSPNVPKNIQVPDYTIFE